MMEPKWFVLHVEDIDRSAALYTDLLGITPMRPSPTFASFPLSSGAFFELKQRSASDPPAEAASGDAETCFPATSREEVERICADWRGRGLRIALEPSDKILGYTFVALDPDGHRLRVILDTQEAA